MAQLDNVLSKVAPRSLIDREVNVGDGSLSPEVAQSSDVSPSLSPDCPYTHPPVKWYPSVSGWKKPGRKSVADRHIIWDEETILMHDADRGTRMKIDEACTPFHRLSSGDVSEEESSVQRQTNGQGSGAMTEAEKKEINHGVSADVLTARLQYLIDHCHTNSSSTSACDNNSQSDVEGSRFSCSTQNASHSPESRRSFADARKAHYNEFKILQLLRENSRRGLNGAFDADVDDDEDDKQPQVI